MGMAGKVDVADVLLIEITIQAAGIIEQPRLAAEAEAIEAGQNQADESAKTC